MDEITTQPGTIKPIVRLENWEYIEFPFPRLVGNAYDHPRFPAGQEVWTSRILGHGGETGSRPLLLGQGVQVETKNTVYTLGKRND
jgi:hypothetical protein